MKLEETGLDRIHFADERFRISYHCDLDRLKRSIAESGLLSPIVITPRSRRLVIVTGWKRALACRELSFSAVPCFILEQSEDLKAFLLAVSENAVTREFNPIELALILKKLKTFGLEERAIRDTYLPIFGIPQTLAHLDVYLAMAELDAHTKEFIVDKRVSYPVIQQLLELDERERAALVPHLRHLGQNKQKELLEFLLEISKRDNIPPLLILASNVPASIIKSTALSPPQKADKLRLLLRERRYPSYSDQENAFGSSLKKMAWPGDIDIEHSPFFEGEDLSVHFTFKDSAQFQDKVEKLQKMASENTIAELLKLISNG
jgi:ParB-like chromosome segregation protein Spo0J